MEPDRTEEQPTQPASITFELEPMEAIDIMALVGIGVAVMTQDRDAYLQIAKRIEGKEAGERVIAAVRRMNNVLRVAFGAEPEGEAA